MREQRAAGISSRKEGFVRGAENPGLPVCLLASLPGWPAFGSSDLTVTLGRTAIGLIGLLLLTITSAALFFYRQSRRPKAAPAPAPPARDLAAAQLRQAERKYQALLDHVSEGIFQTTPDGRFLAANQALARMYGYQSPEQLIESLSAAGIQPYVQEQDRETMLRRIEARAK